MDEKSLVLRLNWFYSLEITQVENYLAQSRAVKDKYISAGLERVAAIEDGHVDNIRNLIVGLGGKPKIISDVIFPILGSAAGKILSFPDVASMMKKNIAVEAKAVQDYQELINKLGEQNEKYLHLIQTLKYNLMDEDLHTSWFYQIFQYHQNPSWPLSPELNKLLT
ncbi:MAG: ferritin-like domain-containing protein [Clostridia bacterium]|nr:ferritin-like domain-containing protein [Clostridia bacterium]